MLPGHLRVLKKVWTAPGNASNRPLAILRAFHWFIACHRKSIPDDQPELYRAFGSRVFPCYTDSIIAKHVMYHSEWFDHDLLHFMDDFLRPTDHYLDVGANTGLHTILASTRITEGHITCVEADPKNVIRLRRALELNHINHANILPVAASDSAGTTALDGTDVFTRIAPPSSQTTEERTVEMIRLDVALDPNTRVDFCKIDVEGAEWQVLRGMTGLMEKGSLPVIAFEFNGNLRTYGHTEVAFLSWLISRGYTIARYHHDSRTFTTDGAFTSDDIDLFAFTTNGWDMMRDRMPGISR